MPGEPGPGPVGVLGVRRRVRLLALAAALAAGAQVAMAWSVHAHRLLAAPWAVAAAAGLGAVVVWLGDREARQIDKETQAVVEHVRQQAVAQDRQQVEQEHREVESERREFGQWLSRWALMIEEGGKAVVVAVEHLRRGEQPAAVVHPSGPRPDEPILAFEYDLCVFRAQALDAVVQAATRPAGQAQQAAAFVHIARRLQTLATRQLTKLDDLEDDVEDPVLLHGLYELDHLVVLARRQVESIAVLGGAEPRRAKDPLLLAGVLQQVAAEIAEFRRVRVVHTQLDVALPGFAVPGVIHLLAELVENATKFSPHGTQVEVRVELVTTGVAVTVEDRGLRMKPDKLAHMNSLLAAPSEIDKDEQLRQGRIGLPVAALLAQRYGIHVELRDSVLGGTQALVLLPHRLLTTLDTAPPHLPATPAGPPQAAAIAACGGSRLPPQGEPQPAQVAAPGVGAHPYAEGAVGVGSAEASGRPELPRRSEAQPPQRAPDAPASRARGHARPANPGNPRLLAQFTAGTGPSGPDPAPPGLADPTP